MKTKRHLAYIIFLAMLMSYVFPAPVSSDDPIYTMASILRGEAPQDCFMCRMITARAIIEDFEKGVNLFSRWYGWKNARPQDIRLIELMLSNPSVRVRYPLCRFVGMPTDLNVWAPRGYTDNVEIKTYCSRNGCTVCVPFPEKQQKQHNPE